MTKYYVTALATAILFGWGDNARADGVGFGVKAGVAISHLPSREADVKSSTPDMNSGLTRPVFGIFAELPLSTRIALRPEATILDEGSQVEITSRGVSLGTRYAAHVLEVPVLLTNARQRRGWYAAAGAAMTFRLSADFAIRQGGGSWTSTGAGASSVIHAYWLSGVLAGGVQFSRSSVEARWTEGFTDFLAPVCAHDVCEPQKGRPRSFSFTFGYRFK